MDTRWITDFKALRTLLPIVAGSDSYDHDAVSSEELDELFSSIEMERCASVVEVPSPGPDKSLSAAAAEHGVSPQTDARGESPGVEIRRNDMPMEEGSADIPDTDEEWLGAATPLGAAVASEAVEFDFSVPEIGGAEVPEVEADYSSEVSGETRARQLATDFLKRIGELTSEHVDWVADIILARRWGTAQRKVIELYLARHSLKAIYRAFEVSQAWRECDYLDERFGEALSQSWGSMASPRISWLEAVNLVSFVGEDASVEEILAFVDHERYLWRQTPYLIQRFPRFKQYLLDYRLSDECKRPCQGWYRTLDPNDGRFFDGCSNPEYTDECWEDDMLFSHSSQRTAHRLFTGHQLADLIPEQDDGIQWWED